MRWRWGQEKLSLDSVRHLFLPSSTTLSQAEIGFVTGCALGMDPCWVTKEGFQEVGRMGKDLGRWRWRET